ncbi:phosphoglucomutase/phosphomannomutase alpha/beta/alpha domain I [Paenibacillus curdlanolyticus YK9]|uniref:phosphoglucomutase (alpha-D-glucose-1,6-bisphosphate-dependent) n=1 Tax=Paenibacillus curdlanolyticus YK9 TaxID=717606 RepID=E0IEF8_9BACL|nr:phospho-sugar mutase [Paenibacillus curdlanolyticus]EFM09046.1 phosphoglucomutase/phosphomannomutase alpha/beta/alpha domain I [Paenibacillus curdlanolyticus YK9]
MSINEAAIAKYEAWLNDTAIDETTKEELRGIAGNEKEIVDRFYRDLEFGTGGLRGVMGAGTNRLNAYTVGKATQGLADWVLSQGAEAPSVVIAHDSRNNSPEFALDAALVLAANGITAYLFPSLRPTPQLSFSVRALKATAGIVITASHNPPEYNGYKAYNKDGCQLVPHEAEQAIARIQAVTSFEQVRTISREEAESNGLLLWLGQAEDEQFAETVAACSLNRELLQNGLGERVSVVFTPLHGSGNVPVRSVLAKAGFSNVHIVPEQEQPDGYFSTVKSPNPEEREAFTKAIALAKQVDADIIIGTDPDADRMGAVVKNNEGEYVVLSGNQSGAIMVYYTLSQLKEQGKLPANGIVVKTIVTSEMGADIAQSFGASVTNTLTGFKYIGEKMTQYEATGEHTFLFGYEESYGYLTGTYARDKDAVVASLLICEAAAYYKNQGKTLYDVLLELYAQYGTYLEGLQSRTLKGLDGVQQIAATMEQWRDNPPAEVAGVKVDRLLDYNTGLDGLPKENVLKFMLADGSWFCLRPSGTEPKIKVYFAVRGQSPDDASAALERLTTAVMDRVDQPA